ncbi:MAG: ATP-binding protein [Erysipelotrichaceae bacterium]|nr:ATP-binding protein [Erysipelotrichaceae bacterium]
MKEYKSERHNPFTLSFGKKPFEYIGRDDIKNELISQIQSEPIVSNCFVITGVRGSGKTVMLTAVSKHFETEKDWIVIDLNPEDDLREGLAAKLYTAAKVKHLFLEKNFSVSFHGFSFSLSGKNPVPNIEDLLLIMLEKIKKQGKKVLITIDEASKNNYMKQFALSFQSLIRKEMPIVLLVTSLYENISALENEKNMTFLIRSPKIFLSPLSLQAIVNSYEANLGIEYPEALKCAKLTKGYAFAFQLLGYLMFAKNKKEADKEILSSYDQHLDEYVYAKIWSTLSEVERKIVMSFQTNSSLSVSAILERTGTKKEYFSRYRDRLIKKGILISPTRGKLMFNLPRFKEFIDAETAYDY